MIKLWDFQQEAALKTRGLFSRLKRLILCSPTGSGKTIMACWLAMKSIQKGKTVCILVDRKEILSQFIKALAKFNLYPELIVAGSKPRKSQLYLGMVESFNRRYSKSHHLQGIDFFIMDECHSTAYFKIITQATKAFILGLTATPVLTTKNEHLKDYYEDIVELAKVEQLIDKGYLCDAQTYSVDLTDSRKLRRSRGDFTVSSQREAMDNMTVYSGVLDNFKRICPDAKFICYNIDVEHSKKMASHFSMNGIRCRHVDGESDPEYRKETFEMLESGEIQGVHNFGICTTGFDEPSIKCIIQNFATDSMSKHIQTAGRGARIYDGKEKFYILDMGMNYSRHGLWNRDKDWSDIFHNPESAEDKDRKQTEALNNLNCTTCGYILNGDLETCPICGALVSDIIATKTRKARTSNANAELKLIREQAKANLPRHLKDKKPSSMNLDELKEYAKIMQYDPKWVYITISRKGRRWK